MARVEADLTPLREMLERAQEAFGTPEPLLKAIGVAMLGEVGRIMAAGGDPPWKPLAESTRAAARKSSTFPLAGLRALWDLRTTERQAIVFNHSGVAVFHQFGTRGPYKISAKNGKALALPFLPGRDAGRGRTPGRFSLSGLGRARRVKLRGGGTRLITQPAGFPGAPTGRHAARAGKAVVPYTRVAFYQSVMHPGLDARPMLPDDTRAGEVCVGAARTFLAQKGVGTSGA